MSITTIYLQQEHKPHAYIFDQLWGRDGGSLHGNNFFTDICTGNSPIHKKDGVYIVPADENDPDFLIILWKHGRGEPFGPLIDPANVIFMHEWSHANGFPMLLPGIVARNAPAHGCVII